MKSQLSTIIFFGITGVLAVIVSYYLYTASQSAFFGTASFSFNRQSAQTSLLDGKYVCAITQGKNIITTVYINKKTIRADNIFQKDNQPINALLDKETIYVWNPLTKQGATKKYPGIINLLSMMIENYRSSCKTADSFKQQTFTVPSDVAFIQSTATTPQGLLQDILTPQSKK